MLKRAAAIFICVIIICLPTYALDSGEMIPSFSLPGIDGTFVDSESLRGNIVIVDFWATWCPPCRISLPRLAELSDKYSDRGVKVVLISVDRTPQTARELLEQMGLQGSSSLIALFDTNELAARLFHPPTMPTTFVFDRNGRVVMVHHGFKAGDEKLLQYEIDSQLKSAENNSTKV